MSNEIEEIESGVKRRFQVALLAGLRVGQELGTSLKDRLAKIKTARAEEARQLQAAFDRERDQAAAELAQTSVPEWWDKATPDDIGRAATLAQAWEPHLENGSQLKEQLFEQLEQRYQIRTYETGTHPDLIAAQLKVWEQDRETEARSNGGVLTEQAAAEIATSEAVQEAAPKKSNVRFVPVAEAETATEPSQAEVLAAVAKMPPQEQLTTQHREALGQWAMQDPEVDAAIWRKYPEVFPDLPAPGAGSEQTRRDAARERGREAEDLAAANLQAKDADRLAAESRNEKEQTGNDPDSPHQAAANKLQDRSARAGADADLAYDSAERRALSASVLEEKGVDQEAIDAHMISDMAQGKPAREAVSAKQVTKARPNRGNNGRTRSIERTR